jgi:hypothetical protein
VSIIELFIIEAQAEVLKTLLVSGGGFIFAKYRYSIIAVPEPEAKQL